MKQDPIVIVSCARTPMGGFQGDLKSLTAPQLGAAAIRAAVERAGLPPENVQDVLMGCVLPAGQGQAPARQAALGAGLARATTCTTVNKMCGSGMQTAILAHDQLLAGSSDIVVAGGMESMTNAPYLLEKARAGYRMGHGRVLDHMFLDGLEDSFDKGRLMGSFAEECADAFGFTREQQDAYAIESLRRAQAAIASGAFADEIVALDVTDGKQQRQVRDDEQPPKASLDKIPQLRPAFREGGTVTAANSSSISDGAAALVMMRRSEAERWGLQAQAVIHGHAAYADAPAASPPRPSGQSASSWNAPAGAWPTSTSSRSTKPLPWCRWRRCASWTSITRGSTSMAAPVLWATRLALPARAFSRRSSMRYARVNCAAAWQPSASVAAKRRRWPSN